MTINAPYEKVDAILSRIAELGVPLELLQITRQDPGYSPEHPDDFQLYIELGDYTADDGRCKLEISYTNTIDGIPTGIYTAPEGTPKTRGSFNKFFEPWLGEIADVVEHVAQWVAAVAHGRIVVADRPGKRSRPYIYSLDAPDIVIVGRDPRPGDVIVRTFEPYL